MLYDIKKIIQFYMLLDVLERKDNLDTKGTLEFKIKYMFVGSLSSCIFHAAHILCSYI